VLLLQLAIVETLIVELGSAGLMGDGARGGSRIGGADVLLGRKAGRQLDCMTWGCQQRSPAHCTCPLKAHRSLPFSRPVNTEPSTAWASWERLVWIFALLVLPWPWKVDMEALPQSLINQLKQGKVDLDDPATTLALIKLDSVLGVKGTFNPNGSLNAIGLTCAVCHSTVDDAFAPGIGRRLDGWSNQDLNVGAIVSLAPDLSAITNLLGVDEATVKTVLASWGPGKFDAELNLDGKAFRPDGKTAAVIIPPAFGQAGVNLHTWGGGWGGVTYWNAYVANLELQGQGTFYDARLNDPVKYPVAARAGFGNKRSEKDMVTAKLGALQFYQLAIPPPKPPEGSFDKAAATRGEAIFNGKATCAECHVPPLFTEPGWNTHKASEIGIDDFHASRAPDNSYRTTPLRGLFTHMKRGFYHDGRFATLLDVVNHYDNFKGLGLTEQEKKDLVEYLKSL